MKQWIGILIILFLIVFPVMGKSACFACTGGTSGGNVTATIDVNWTFTGAPGTSALVTNIGTTSAALLNFVVPAGANGATGADGAANMTAGPEGMMNQTPNMTAGNADMTWNASYYLRDNSRTLTGEKMRRDVDNDLFSLYGGNALAGGTGGIISLFGKDTVNPFSVEINVGDGAVANTRVTGWVGGATPRMDMNSYNISNVKDPVTAQDAATKNYVDTHSSGGSSDMTWNITYMLLSQANTWFINNNSATLRTADDHIATNVTDIKNLMVTNQTAVWNNKTWDTVANQSTYVIAVNNSQIANISTYVIQVNNTLMANTSMYHAPLVSGKVPTVNLGGAGADATKYLRGDQSWQVVTAGSPTSATAMIAGSEFYDPTTGAIPGFLGAAISSGTVGAVATTGPHPGVIYMRDSTTSLGGYRYGCAGRQIIAGGESFEFIFQPVGVRVGQNAKIGWADTAAAITNPVDGVYFNISGTGAAITLRGNTSSNSVRSGTLTTYTPTTATWYRGTIVINSAATLVTYTVYNEAGASVWTDTVASNIPTGAGRDTSPCIIVAESSTDAAADILRLDYAKWEIVRALVR